jgi:hypothetical protein
MFRQIVVPRITTVSLCLRPFFSIPRTSGGCYQYIYVPTIEIVFESADGVRCQVLGDAVATQDSIVRHTVSGNRKPRTLGTRKSERPGSVFLALPIEVLFIPFAHNTQASHKQKRPNNTQR